MAMEWQKESQQPIGRLVKVTYHSYMFWFGVALILICGVISWFDGQPNSFRNYVQFVELWLFMMGIMASVVGVFEIATRR